MPAVRLTPKPQYLAVCIAALTLFSACHDGGGGDRAAKTGPPPNVACKRKCTEDYIKCIRNGGRGCDRRKFQCLSACDREHH